MSLCCIKCCIELRKMNQINKDGVTIKHNPCGSYGYGVCKVCESPLYPIDDNIVNAIFELNSKGYITTNCCSGHKEGERFYIQFVENQSFELPSFLHYDNYGDYVNGKWIPSKTCIEGTLEDNSMIKLFNWLQQLPCRI